MASTFAVLLGPLTVLNAVLASAQAVSIPRLNVVLIVADDLGFHDCSFTGSNISTPNIDRLVSEGVRLSQYYGQPVCSPSRAAMMTGRYPIAYGLQTYVIDPAGVDYSLNLNETLLPQLLKSKAGYQTHAVGKWHLGMAAWNMTPTFRGFDSFHGFYSGGQDYFTHIEGAGFDLHKDVGARCGPGCSIVDWDNKGTFSTYLYASSAVSVIQAHDPAQGPLFLYLPFQAVHAPDEVPQHYIDPYNATIPNLKRRTFAGMLSALDEGVGNVTAALAAAGLADNTLIFFLADNGGPIECNASICGDSTGTTNFPLRGGKHSLWEGGVRLTAAAWGSMLSETGGNRTGLMHHTDLLPTILEAAGLTLAPGDTLPLHGSSQWAMVQSGAPSTRNEILLNIDPMQPLGLNQGNAALRVGKWKLQVGQTGPPWGYMPEARPRSFLAGENLEVEVQPFNPYGYGLAHGVVRRGQGAPPRPHLWPLQNMTVSLYDLDADPLETDDVSASNPDVVDALLSRLAYWGKEVQVMPLYWNATVDPASSPAKHNGSWIPWLPM